MLSQSRGYPMLDTRPLMPSEAKRQLTELLLKRLEQAPLNWYASPIFAYSDAFKLIFEDDDYARSILFHCYEDALRQYERLHPKQWDLENQKAFRQGIGSSVPTE